MHANDPCHVGTHTFRPQRIASQLGLISVKAAADCAGTTNVGDARMLSASMQGVAFLSIRRPLSSLTFHCLFGCMNAEPGTMLYTII